MDWKEIISSIAVVLIGISSIVMVIMCVYDIIKSHKYYKDMQAHLDLMRVTFKKEHDLRHAVVEFGDELIDYYYDKAKKDFYEKENDYNHGYLNATEEIVGSFLDKLEKHIGDWDGEKSSD